MPPTEHTLGDYAADHRRIVMVNNGNPDEFVGEFRVMPATPTTQADPKVAGALFDFLGWLTTREEPVTLSGSHDASVAVDVIRQWAAIRGFSLDEADVQHWQDRPVEGESLSSQIDRLAKFIMYNVPDEPSESMGAVDTAIRIMAKHYPSG